MTQFRYSSLKGVSKYFAYHTWISAIWIAQHARLSFFLWCANLVSSLPKYWKINENSKRADTNIMILASIVVVTLLWPLLVKGVPINEEPPLSTEELLPHKENEESQERFKNEVLHEIATFLDKKVNLESNCIAVSPKLISYLQLHYESGFFWYKLFIIQVFYKKGLIKISNTESVNIIHFCHWNILFSLIIVHPASTIILRDFEDSKW